MMTPKQLFLKTVYPVFIGYNKMFRKPMNTSSTVPAISSIYELETHKNDGTLLSFSQFKGKRLMVVNTASDCGFTPQYDELQKLHQSAGSKLVIIGFPSNDFGEQEQKDNSAIQEFCRVNFGVTFPLMAKSTVKKSEGQNPVFAWLSNESLNGWNDKAPSWNFCKYIINEKGDLTHIFGASTSPFDPALLNALGIKAGSFDDN